MCWSYVLRRKCVLHERVYQWSSPGGVCYILDDTMSNIAAKHERCLVSPRKAANLQDALVNYHRGFCINQTCCS